MKKTEAITTDGVKILQYFLNRDEELKQLYEEECKKLEIADKIKEARIKAGISQTELARRIHSTQPVIARLESSNYNRFSMGTLVKIATALGLNIKFDMVPADQIS